MLSKDYPSRKQMTAHRSVEFIHEDIIFNLDLPISVVNKVLLGGIIQTKAMPSDSDDIEMIGINRR